MLKNTGVLSLAGDLKIRAAKSGKNVTEYVNDGIAEAKKERKDKKYHFPY